MKTKSPSTIRKVIVTVLSCVIVLTVVSTLYLGLINNGLPFSQVSRSYVINRDDPREMAGFADYVFVGRVEKQNEVVYEDVFERETENGSQTIGAPYTGFNVIVLENAKGNLKVDETVVIWKSGGRSMDGKHFLVAEDDPMPEIGDVCIFYASADENGGLYGNKNVKITNSKLTEKAVRKMSSAQVQQAAAAELETIEDSSVYQELVDACENEVPFERERYTAPAEYLEATTED